MKNLWTREIDSLKQQQKSLICPTLTYFYKVCSKSECSKSVCNLCSFGSKEHDKIRVHKMCLPKTVVNLYMVDQKQSFVPSSAETSVGTVEMEDVAEIEFAARMEDAVELEV